jgi:hypothetical protein
MSLKTLSPTLNFVASGPAASTTPATSTPSRLKGLRGARRPRKSLMNAQRPFNL